MSAIEQRVDDLLDRHFESIRETDKEEASAGAFYGFHARVGFAVTCCGMLIHTPPPNGGNPPLNSADMACESLVHCLVTCGPSDPEERLPDEDAIRNSIHAALARLNKRRTDAEPPEVRDRVAAILTSAGSASSLMDSLEYSEALEMVVQATSVAAQLTIELEDAASRPSDT